MTRTRIALLVALGGLLAGLLLWAAGEAPVGGAEWRVHQQRWNQLARGRGAASIRLGVRNLRGAGGDLERCASCHLGAALGAEVVGRGRSAADPAAAAPQVVGRGRSAADPLLRHPAVPCALAPGRDGVGCVACHGGDGLRSSSRTAAHAGLLDLGARDHAERARRLEPGCAGCHEQRAEGGASGAPRAAEASLRDRGEVLAYDERVVPEVASGLRLYLEDGCPSCHRLARVYRATDGGPSLDGVGARRTRTQLLERLRQPQLGSPSSPMPPSTRAAHELEALIAFLLAQRKDAPPAPARAPGLGDHFPKQSLEVSSPSAAFGALWARRLGCVGCHRLGEADSGVPDLRLVGWYATGEELLLALREPGRRFPGGHMPRIEIELPPLLTASLLEYLALQRAPLPSSPEEVLRGVCLRCHGPAGVRDPKAVVLARRPPSLTPPPPRDRFLEAVMNGRKGTAMAPWGRALSRSFVESLRTALETLGPRGEPRGGRRPPR